MMLNVFGAKNCLMLLLILPIFTVLAESINCQNYAYENLTTSTGLTQLVDFKVLNEVGVACLEDFDGEYDTTHLKGLTEVNFLSKSIRVFVTDKISGSTFLLVLIHEMTHAQQYLAWVKPKHSESKMSDKINTIHKLVKPQSLNASFQTIARMKRRTEFKSDANKWYRSYVNMRFCMEYQAYYNESRYAALHNLSEETLPEHLRALKQHRHEPLLELINSTLVKRLFDKLYSNKELKQAHLICGEGTEPFEWFSASAKTLNQVDL